MNVFEKYYIQDLPREKFESIEKADHEYYSREDVKKVNIPPSQMLENLTEEGNKTDEKSKSKATKRKSKKVHSKPYATAMAKVQKEL